MLPAASIARDKSFAALSRGVAPFFSSSLAETRMVGAAAAVAAATATADRGGVGGAGGFLCLKVGRTTPMLAC